MKFKTLQENLRHTLLERIDAGALTGLRLAEQTGFKQAHISNFLNRKRSLSLQGMDRVLHVQHLSVLDLLDPADINQRATVRPPSDGEFDNILVVDAAAATDPLIMNRNVREIQKFQRTFLRRLRPDMRGNRRNWERFVAITAARDAMSMHPRLEPGALVLIDRHYNSLEPYHRGESNMYAVRMHDGLRIGYVETAGDNLIVRPHNQNYAVEIVAVGKGESVSDYLVGRVCFLGMEV